MDLATFAKQHVPQITATIGLVSYALARNKFTPGYCVQRGLSHEEADKAHPLGLDG